MFEQPDFPDMMINKIRIELGKLESEMGAWNRFFARIQQSLKELQDPIEIMKSEKLLQSLDPRLRVRISLTNSQNQSNLYLQTTIKIQEVEDIQPTDGSPNTYEWITAKNHDEFREKVLLAVQARAREVIDE